MNEYRLKQARSHPQSTTSEISPETAAQQGLTREPSLVEQKMVEGLTKLTDQQSTRELLKSFLKPHPATGRNLLDEQLETKREVLRPPLHALAVQVTDHLRGSGEPVLCGYHVTLHYTEEALVPSIPEGHHLILYDTHKRRQPVGTTLGEKHLPLGLEWGVLGMRLGGTRTIMAPALLAYDNTDFENTRIPPHTPILYEVELVGMLPTMPAVAHKQTVHYTRQVPPGRPILCGDRITFHYQVATKDGKKLYDSRAHQKPWVAHASDASMPLGALRILSNMAVGDKASSTIPGRLLQNMHGGYIKGFLPSTDSGVYDMVVLDLEVIEAHTPNDGA